MSKGLKKRIERLEELLVQYQQTLRNHARVVTPIPKPGCTCSMCRLDNEATEFLKPGDMTTEE